MFGKDFDDIFGDFEKMMSYFDNQMNNTWKSKLSGEWDKKEYLNDDGSIRVTTFSRSYNPSSKSGGNLTMLKKQLELAIQNEDFESAVKLRDQIKNYESNSEKIGKLESELKEAITSQDFERAIELRDEIKKLKS